MKNFEFESQICTTKEQSERLLALGLKKETADCHWFYHDEHWEIKIGFDLMSCENLYPKYYIPAWSLDCLIHMAKGKRGVVIVRVGESNYAALIKRIEYLIKQGIFNKDYLEEK